MAMIDDWREKHPRKSGKSRLILYVFLLAFVIFLILRANTFISAFSSIFFPPDSSASAEESYSE